MLARPGWLAVAVAVALVAVGALAARADEIKKFPKPSDAERLDLIRRSRVFTPTDVAAKDLYEGPPGELPFHVDDEVACTFVPKQMNGWTEKFSCKLEDGTVVKVKYNGPSDDWVALFKAKRREITEHPGCPMP